MATDGYWLDAAHMWRLHFQELIVVAGVIEGDRRGWRARKEARLLEHWQLQSRSYLLGSR